MVPGHRKFSMFLLNEEIIETLLLRKLITQSYTVIKYTETDDDFPLLFRLRKRCSILNIVVTDIMRFTPHGLPCLIELAGLLTFQGESIHEICFLQSLGSMLVFS